MAEPPRSPRHVVVVARAAPVLRARGRGIASAAGHDVTTLSAVLASAGVTMRPLFGASEARVLQRRASLQPRVNANLPDLSVYYRIDAPEERLEDIASQVRQHPTIAGAYVKPSAEQAVRLTAFTPAPGAPPATTPDFSIRQGYLGAAPEGVDALHAWTLPGGDGSGVNIIDCEWNWRLTHEDLQKNNNGVLVGSPSFGMDHGTAVLGEMGAGRDGFGVTGVCPGARIGEGAFPSDFSLPGISSIIVQAASHLHAGDILLLEIHYPGPRAGFLFREDQQGYIPIEWWPDDFDAIAYAIGQGIVVVEAGGNGAEDLDDALYETAAEGFPPDWRNPFRRAARDSGAILVGAGAPPPGTHGADWGPDRSRLDFSNFGSAFDAQAWGREITTTGYGDLQGPDEDRRYTDQFGGTSGASPIIAGAIACVQGVRLAQGQNGLTPRQVRNLLRTTGFPQQHVPGRPSAQRIGNRPDLRQLIPAALLVP